MIKIVNLRTALVTVVILFMSFLGQSQVVQTGAKNNTVDYERLAKIDGLVNEYISKNWLTGAVSIVIKDNQVVQYKGYGYADVATKKPMKNDAIFRIMSQTKAITSVGIMILYEQGKLLLDQHISDSFLNLKNLLCWINSMMQIQPTQLFLQKARSLFANCSPILPVLIIRISVVQKWWLSIQRIIFPPVLDILTQIFWKE